MLLDEILIILREENVDNVLTNCLRQEIVKWACTLDHPKCAVIAYHKLHHYLQNPEKHP